MTQIARGQAHVWVLPVEAGDEVAGDLWNSVLSDEEVGRVGRIQHERNRREYIAAHLLSRLMLAQFSGVAAPQWRFVAGDHGRPEPVVDGTNGGFRFNLSHASGMVACGLTRVDDIGVDVEWVDRPNRFADIAKKKFSPPEVDYFSNVPEEQRRKVFFSFWTLKESYIKAIGKGLVEPLDGFAFRLEPLGISFLRENGDPDGWTFDLFDASPDHLCAVSLARPSGAGTEIIRRFLDWDEFAESLPTV